MSLDNSLPDFLPGDPVRYVLGKKEEKKARVHGDPPPKPGPTMKTILADIQLRKAQLEWVDGECARLQRALDCLNGI